MSPASFRVKVLKLAQISSFLSIAAFASATPAGFPTIADLGVAVIRPVTGFSAGSGEAGLAGAAKPATHKLYSRIESLPAAGSLEAIDLTEPPATGLSASRLAVRVNPPAAAEEVLYSAFVIPLLGDRRAFALARLPLAKPDHVFTYGPDGQLAANSAVLAYAPASAEITAPFEAVMSGNGPRMVDIPDDGAYRPRPRPDPEMVLDWLDGRALGQFAPGQHSWVQNQLPKSVWAPKEQKCLAEGIYFEARGEPELGQAAVAQVILNRVRNPAYPDTICGVVYQNKRQRNRCQFSFACDGRAERINEQRQWLEARQIARDVTEGKIWIAEVGDSTHYYANYVRPGWARRMIKMNSIGAHLFYRTRFGGWS